MYARTLFAAALALAGLTACATIPQTPHELIVGKWNCTADTPDGKISGPMTYRADGTTTFTLTMESAMENGIVAIIVADGAASWKLPGDGTIEEAINDVKIRSARVGATDIPASMLGDIEDQMLDEQPTPSAIEISRSDMVLTDQVGTKTVCKR